jgi:aryl-alcohol dehydrogenase-like predicted oxidoreductase
MLETDTVDVMMVAMNFVDRFVYGFEEKVLPAARKRETGVLAMKVFGGVAGGFGNYGKRDPHPSQLDAEHHRASIRYARSLEGVCGMVIGVHSAEQLRRNIELVVKAEPLAKEELDKLLETGKEIAAGWSPRFGPVT